MGRFKLYWVSKITFLRRNILNHLFLHQTNMKVLLFFIAALLFTNCVNKSEIVKPREKLANESIEQVALTPVINTQPTTQPVIDKKKYKGSIIEGAKGLLVLADGYDKPNDFLRFYDEDKSLWYEFTFYYEDSDGKFEYENGEFSPYSFHQDYFLLALKYVAEDANRFRVIVNDKKDLQKYVNKADKNLKFETWEEHILKTFAIEFKENENPLRETPNGKIKKVEFSKIDRFGAVEFEGEWLKVEWDTESNPDNDPSKTDFGWVKWKKGEKLLIEWFYLS